MLKKRSIKLRYVFYVFILFIISFFLYSCVKKQAPIIAEIPVYNATNKTIPSYNKTNLFFNETIVINNQTEEIPSKEVVSEVFSEEKNEVEKNKKIEKEEKTKKEKRSYWKLYGRGTPPLLAIFFDYDDYSIREDMWDRIKQNVKYLLEHPQVKIQLQGNCDERGTNEYNMALGAKRALEVKKMLVKLGIKEERISTISFGEERPLAKCHSETCWALNRRVDFVIIK